MNLKKSPFVLDHNLTFDTKICRYMNFDVFLQLLYGKLFVPRREIFLDARESGKLPKKNRFTFDIIGDNTDYRTDNQECIDKYAKKLMLSKYLLTSCWTFNNGENYLMWKSYTNTIGVCVCTTIIDLLNSIDYDKDDYIPICSPMVYDNDWSSKDYADSLFRKDKYYISENEIRIYFVLKSEILDIDLKQISNPQIGNILLKASHKEKEMFDNSKQSVKYKLFDINPIFIKSVILSPEIKSNTISCFKNMLMNQFPNIFKYKNMIKPSDILI